MFQFQIISSGFDFKLIVIDMSFCTDVPNFIRSATELWRCVNFLRWLPHGGHTIANLLRFPILWRLAFTKAKNYLHTKFQPDISVHRRDITTSGCWKQTSTILKFYSRFRFYVISIFQDGGRTVANLLPFSGMVMSHVSEGKKHTKCRPNIHGLDITTSAS